MKNNVIVWIIVIVVILGGLVWLMNRPSVVENEVPVPEQEEEAKSIVVSLSTQNNSGMAGAVTLTELNDVTLVSINLNGASVGVSQPAHIHTASCASIGGVVYPLTSLVNGVSQTTIDVSIDTLMASLPLAINVHKSATESNVYVACGDIVR